MQHLPNLTSKPIHLQPDINEPAKPAFLSPSEKDLKRQAVNRVSLKS